MSKVATAPVFTFDREQHAYSLNGLRIPGVTEILVASGIIDVAWYTSDGRTRGQDVAAITAWDDDGSLDPDTVDPDYLPYLDAWRRFRADTQCELLGIEEPLFHPTYLYAGTRDRKLRMGGAVGVADIKTGTSERWHSLQLAAYQACDAACEKRWSIVLDPGRKSKPYRVIEQSGAADMQVFLSALTVCRWRGILKGHEPGKTT